MTDEELIAKLRADRIEALRARVERLELVAREARGAREGWRARAEAAEAQIATLTARVEGLTGAVWLKVGECLAGMTHREVSQEARARIKRALDAALSATTEEGHE